ncbi:hypothetical protein P3T76_000913 [Phytophthora citrophthora]|uniref:RxLR effector protein n=1 Tax=Phytophthora citrophthora TaxID=4793 RepID=A0AAD9GZ32_9STRA|nr:hypothetical protein P3T76_000913 [Phytophthora citrophthora]
MKLVALAVLASAAASVGASANTIGMQRGLRVETEDDDAITVEELRDDDLGANEDFWGSWENHYAVDTSSGSSTPGHNPSVGEAARGILQQAETVVTSALPFSIDHAKSLVLPICLVVAALFAVAIAAVLVGVRRQQLSEPMFGPVELVSDLPVPMTTSAVDNDDSDSDSNPLSDADDTGATILVGEEEEETKEEDRDELVVA